MTQKKITKKSNLFELRDSKLISTRTMNSLFGNLHRINSKYEYPYALKDILKTDINDMLKFRNFGIKSYNEIKTLKQKF